MEDLFGVQDLEDRWVYPRSSVHNIINREGFPQPDFIVNRGRTKLWRQSIILAHEKVNPYLVDELEKRQKILRESRYNFRRSQYYK